MNIEQLHKEWFAYKSQRIKPSSLATYENAYVVYVQPYFAKYDMMLGVNNKQMNAFVDYLIQEKGLSRKSAQDCKIVLGNMLKFGSSEHDIPLFTYNIEYPTKNMEQRQALRFFNKEQCKKVFAEMDKDPSSELLGMVLGLTTGMRIGELVGLRFSDCDMQEKTITVNRTIERIHTTRGTENIDLTGIEVISQANNSAVVANPPKTATSHRTCPLSSLPLKWIKLYSKTNPGDRYIIGLGKKPIEPRTYRNWYYQELEHLGLPKLNPHCMRHTFATQMLHSGVDPATTASILGHSSPAITLEIYSHTNEDEKKKQVNAVFGKMFR